MFLLYLLDLLSQLPGGCKDQSLKLIKYIYVNKKSLFPFKVCFASLFSRVAIDFLLIK